MRLDRNIASYYALGAERDRLREPGGRLEFVRTQELLGRFLPSPPRRVIGRRPWEGACSPSPAHRRPGGGPGPFG